MKGGCKNLATIRLVTGKEPGRNGVLHDIKLTFVANESMNKYKGLKIEIVYKNNLHDRRITLVLFE